MLISILKFSFSEVWNKKKGFDIVIGNPPYDVYEGKRKEEIEIIKKLRIFDMAKGRKLNAYKLFLAKSTQLQNPTGILCQIFQNSFLADLSAKNLRRYFLTKQKIVRLDSFPERDDVNRRVFKQAKISVCVLLAVNSKAKEYSFALSIWSHRNMQHNKEAQFTNLEILEFDKESYSIPSTTQIELHVLRKVANHPRFKAIANCYQGEVNLSTYKPLLTTEPSFNTKPLLKGAGIQKWYFPEVMSQGQKEYVLYKQFLQKNKGRKSKHHLVKRLVMQGITGVDENIRIKAHVLGEGVFCAHSVNYMIFNNKEVDLGYYLSILNSEIVNWYFKTFSTNSNVNSYEINNLPIPSCDQENSNKLCILADYMSLLCDVSNRRDRAIHRLINSYFEQLIDGLVYELYFPAELKAAGKEILAHLGNPTPIDDDMSEEEKLAIIQREFERLYDPSHPVRNHLETLDSVEEVRIIQEALKQ